ncbi:MAG: NUDIX hydrolase [Planctomycetes bacterium]|nr:NUDIX hydrolase [Planctomycetota bacterium]
MGIDVQYGMRAEGYDGILIHEGGGGGAVPIPFVIWEKELWIGLLEEERKNMGGRVLDAPGGFLDPKQTHFETAVREFEEEVGVAQVRISDVPLGEPANSNRAWFDTSDEEEGAHFYPVEFLPDPTGPTRPTSRGRLQRGKIAAQLGGEIADRL